MPRELIRQDAYPAVGLFPIYQAQLLRAGRVLPGRSLQGAIPADLASLTGGASGGLVAWENLGRMPLVASMTNC